MTDGKSSLGHEPKEKWEFDESVTRCFGDMLKRSVPGYSQMRRLVHDMARWFARPGTPIIDLGASKGDAIATMLRDRETEQCSFLAVEKSPPMLAAMRARFANENRVKVFDHDLRNGIDDLFVTGHASVVMSVLTLQFVPIEYRQKLVRQAFRKLRYGGAFILVEKVLGSTAEVDALLVEQHQKYKASHGYSQDEINRKRLSLEGVLVPVTAAWNEQLLKGAGFTDVECFWRDLNFAGWVAIEGAL